jgi:hypothetical protein
VQFKLLLTIALSDPSRGTDALFRPIMMTTTAAQLGGIPLMLGQRRVRR